ncbi:OLC1v1023608C2 [Oldenlandia corymbosa var. corymbosa]|uniref:OLC1v1023608C2 n=1 Tax=Oldenlandia corymbosa var. corymbosa TaxID=529605 RepID=A0AAV1C3Z2_OLDCO|nr:OLC1v1023608C2 [Oldenlandia corymbosa var. corymbosa]
MAWNQKINITRRQAPSLTDLCVQVAVVNIRYLGNVGETDFHLLERILPHCNMDQLIHVEDCTEGRDLSPVTNKLWKKFYERRFGVDNVALVVERMKKRKVSFTWRQLYEAKLKDIEEQETKIVERMKQRYENAAADKQKRQVQICMKVPPSSGKRSYFGGSYSSVCNTKSNIMKKAKLDFINRCDFFRRLLVCYGIIFHLSSK